MLPNGVRGTGISAPAPAGDLSDLPATLDRVEDGKRLAFSHGNLHLPVGWGATP